MAGPLKGIRVIEFVGIGPCPFAAMMLADMGAEVIRIDRRPPADNPYPVFGSKFDIMARGRPSLVLDLKHPLGKAVALDLIVKADALMEGFRPGVMEKLGLGPDECLSRNQKLVYARVTGWGQTGPLARVAGHDINYLALSGVVPSMGRPGTPPPPPLNLVGDFGAGGMMSAFGIVCALLEARSSGRGQVVDSAMLDGTALMAAMMFSFRAGGQWSGSRGENRIDGGAHFYDNYECADGKYIAIGAIETQFYKLLLNLCGIADQRFDGQHDVKRWPELKSKIERVFKEKTRAEWCEILEGTDTCFAPVLDFEEAPMHPHNAARQVFLEIDGVVQPAPAPRFSRTVPEISAPPSEIGANSVEILREWGIDEGRIDMLSKSMVV